MSDKSVKYAKPEPASGKKSNRAKTASDTVFKCTLKPEAKEVYLVGEFNDWDPRSDRMTKRQGAFQKAKRLAPGEYQYKFLIDGQWYCDPAASKQVPNKFGTSNSVVRVKEALNK
jgi:1,4-alpha-glucan branching enzyme